FDERAAHRLRERRVLLERYADRRPPDPGAPATGWVHGDFHTGNLLTRDGRLSAVIDFGGLGLGDPACDMMIAHTLLSADSRAAFRAAL
ncbi:phosphotransferase, partial [Streptomyces sp. DT225]